MTSNSFDVVITPQQGQPAVEQYEATAPIGDNRRSCTTKARMSSLSCWMSGLPLSTKYSILVVAFLPGRASYGVAFVGKVRMVKFNVLLRLKARPSRRCGDTVDRFSSI